jgi:Family of unknown function (DUF6428)
LDETGGADAKRAKPPQKRLLSNQPPKTEGAEEEMKTNEFISTMRGAPDRRLLFVDLIGHLVPSGYHLTEIKAASFDTVDCGGQVNHWRETIVQLWVPHNADDEYMTAGKFLKIFDKVSGMVPLDPEAEIRVEYGDENIFPSAYHVRSVMHGANATRVVIQPPATTCKARDRRHAAAAPSCC